MIPLQVALDPLGTQHAVVEGKLLPGLEADHLLVADLQLNAALHSAERAVGLHETIRRAACLFPPARRFVVRMRPVLACQCLDSNGRLSHGPLP